MTWSPSTSCLCLVFQGMGKVDPSTSTCCLTVSYLFFRAFIKWIQVHPPAVSPFLTCSSGPMSMEEVDPKYLIPLFDRLFCCLPASWRRVLRCNREFPKPEVSHLLEFNVPSSAGRFSIKHSVTSSSSSSPLSCCCCCCCFCC